MVTLRAVGEPSPAVRPIGDESVPEAILRMGRITVETVLGVLFTAAAAYFLACRQTRHYVAWWYETFSGELPFVAEHLERGARDWAKGGEALLYHSILESPNIESYLVGRSWFIPRRIFRALVKANHMRIAMEYFQKYTYALIISARDERQGRPFFDRVSVAYSEAAKRARRALRELDSVKGDFYLRPTVGTQE